MLLYDCTAERIEQRSVSIEKLETQERELPLSSRKLSTLQFKPGNAFCGSFRLCCPLQRWRPVLERCTLSRAPPRLWDAAELAFNRATRLGNRGLTPKTIFEHAKPSKPSRTLNRSSSLGADTIDSPRRHTFRRNDIITRLSEKVVLSLLIDEVDSILCAGVT